jgi:hypothetical protein
MEKGRDILGEYGRDIPHEEKPRATKGGVTEAKPLDYHEPKGPQNMHHEGPGIPGTNHTNCGTQGRH